MKTKLHYYYFSLHKPEEKAAWLALEKKLLADGYGPNKFCAWGQTDAPCKNETVEVEIETGHLFADQWNTAEPHNSRVFDWFLQYEINRVGCKRGHWLEITPEMTAARAGTLHCSYCGAQYGPHHERHRKDIPLSGFCDACLDSPYLKETELWMLRLQPVAEKAQPAPMMSVAEHEELHARYVLRQTTGADSRAAKERQKERTDLDADWTKTVEDATAKRDGLLWIWEKGLSLDNVIYYTHTKTFCFGWRDTYGDGLDAAVADKICKILATEKAPFKWEIKKRGGSEYSSTAEAEAAAVEEEILAAVVESGPVVKEGGRDE